MGMLEIPGTLRAGSIMMDADATGGGDNISNSLSQKFSFVDSVPATDGVNTGQTYTYTITGIGNSFYYAKMTLSGKDGRGIHRTAEIEVFNGELQSLFLSNINANDIDVAVYGNTIRVAPLFSNGIASTPWFFTNHVEGYSGTLNGGDGNFGYGTMGVCAGGFNGSHVNTIDRFNTTAPGSSALDFGNLTATLAGINAFAGDGNRGVLGGGDAPPIVDTMQYITIPTNGDAIDFGELLAANKHTGAVSDGSRGVWQGGVSTPATTDTIQYATINTLGDTVDFGNLISARESGAAASNASRGMYTGGSPAPGASDRMEYITISTLGNSTDFGELVEATSSPTSVSDGNRAVQMSGEPATDEICYYTIGTLGDSTDYGELIASKQAGSSCSNGSRGFYMGAYTSGSDLEFITIGTIANAVDWGGELSQGRSIQSGIAGG